MMLISFFFILKKAGTGSLYRVWCHFCEAHQKENIHFQGNQNFGAVDTTTARGALRW